MSYFTDVEKFHRKFKIHYDGPPRDLPQELEIFRELRLNEEFRELVYAKTRADKLDAIVDAIYIALGTAHLMGIRNFDIAWKRVHDANMRKQRATSLLPGKYGHADDIVKPPGWVPPDLSDLV